MAMFNKAGLSGHRQMQVYVIIRSVHEQQGFSLKLLCKLAKVARSSYYKWINHKPSPREQENEQLTENMLAHHKFEGDIH